jgi:hypothetical protein
MKAAELPALLALTCLLALWLRLPGIHAGLPYLYWEDETHHFNRIVEMVKTGSYNPHYFHKPSLHFYLRMPVVALSFIWSAKKGYITSIKEIETRNPFGLATYNFTASHPGIVKWNRALSVLFSLTLIFFTGLICHQITRSRAAALLAALLTSLSPELLKHSPIIGVDVLMSLMCILSIWCALQIQERYSNLLLILCGLFAGLAISSKYNAAPIALLPLIALWASNQFSAQRATLALSLPIIGFFAASPFILVSIPLFLDHLAYEIWHYGVAGHAGQMAEPGLPQALFYLRWLLHDGIGWTAVVSSIFGLLLLFKQEQRKTAVLMAFPLLFAALMIGQKTNFTRNVLILIPIFAVLSASGIFLLIQRLNVPNSFKLGLVFFSLPILLLQPLIGSLQYRKNLLHIRESRVDALEFIQETKDKLTPSAVSGELQFPSSLYRQQGFERTDLSKLSGLALFQMGYHSVIAGPEAEIHSILEFYNQTRLFPGINETQRIIANPEIRVFTVRDDATNQIKNFYLNNSLSELPAMNLNQAGQPSCPNTTSTTESYCWLTNRATAIQLPRPTNKGPVYTLEVKAMSPWRDQKATIFFADYEAPLLPVPPAEPGSWSLWTAQIPEKALKNSPVALLLLEQIQSPRSAHLNADPRHLGLALESLKLTPTR